MTVLKALIADLADAELRVVWGDIIGVRNEADEYARDIAALSPADLREALAEAADSPIVMEKLVRAVQFVKLVRT